MSNLNIKNEMRELLRCETINNMTTIQHMSVKEKRRFFSLLRKYTDVVDENWIFPIYGISVGELCVAQVLETETCSADTNTNVDSGDIANPLRKKPRSALQTRD
jgi:hypothetical protein